jgi:trehalose-phosphatase
MIQVGVRPDARHWDELWRRVQAARRPLLLLDFDGTLAPLEEDRDRVRLPERARELLRQIAAGGARLGVISGRPLAEIQARFHDLPAHLVGEHGWEYQLYGEAPRRHPLAGDTAALLLSAFESMRTRVPASRVERKRTSAVLHVRGLAPAEVAAHRSAVEELWAPLSRHAALALVETDGGWELRARGHDKGSAVAALLAAHGLGTFALYLGDDHTDEDAFAAVARAGFGVRVGRHERPTRAHAELPDVEAVLELLELFGRRMNVQAARDPA